MTAMGRPGCSRRPAGQPQRDRLRAHVAVHAGAAANLGLRLAVDGNRASCIWHWMERHRANGLRLAPARPPCDDTLAALLADLRNAAQEIATCITNGEDPTALLARQDDLERRARRAGLESLWRQADRGEGAGGPAIRHVTGARRSRSSGVR